MPLYEYRCDACGDVFEVLQKFSDKPLETHAGCGGKVQRLLSPPALQFKGTGWYVTDYAHRNGTNGYSSNGKQHKSEPVAKKTETPAAASDKK
jgi:putative FmdB family regulatory protein